MPDKLIINKLEEVARVFTEQENMNKTAKLCIGVLNTIDKLVVEPYKKDSINNIDKLIMIMEQYKRDMENIKCGSIRKED